MVVLALCAMFFQQSFVTIGKVLPAILAPAIFDDLLINPSWLGVYVGIIAFVALTVQVGCGSFIIRYGSLRISQISLLSTGIGLALATPGFTSLMILSAVAIGASASSTPASSHLLWPLLSSSICSIGIFNKADSGTIGPFKCWLSGTIFD